MQLPDHFKLQYTSNQIKDANQRLGMEIQNWIESLMLPAGEQVVAVPILRGSIFFFADLVREISSSISISPVRCWAYSSTSNMVNKEIKMESIDFDVKDKHILLIDDICDSGRTLDFISKEFSKAGAKNVKSAALIYREVSKPMISPDFIAFSYPGDEWFVGYGMDDQGSFRNCPEIYTIPAVS